MQYNTDKLELRAELQGSLLLFTQTFFPLMTGREFILSNPIGRESHFRTICRELTNCFYLDVLNLVIAVPPGHAKSTLLCMFVGWSMTMYPDSCYLYISYSQTLATKHTEFIRRLMSLRAYVNIFDVHLRQDSKAKNYFMTTKGGAVGAFGAQGSITGMDGGLPAQDRFSGAVIIDDALKPDDAHSTTIREGVITNYRETIQQRLRGVNVPIICIAQRLHECDLPAYLLAGKDGNNWRDVVLPSLDANENALYPEVLPKELLIKRREHDIYVFAAQHQQNPQPAGGALFKPEFFPLLDVEPKIIATFITADTAETSKDYNDATVFSFFGVYEIETEGKKTGLLGLHWLDCLEIRVEPKDLEAEFMDFWAHCALHPSPPLVAYIEKKSTGVTLLSVLSKIRGMQVRNVDRGNGRMVSKTQRFLAMQPYLAAKYVSLPSNAAHTEKCINHLKSITANNSHAFDDIADTLADAVKIALIDKTFAHTIKSETDLARDRLIAKVSSQANRLSNLRGRVYGSRN